MRDRSDVSQAFRTRFRRLVGESWGTQATLAEDLFVSRQEVNQWMSGKTVPSIWNLCRIADHFGVSADWLLGRSEGPYGQ